MNGDVIPQQYILIFCCDIMGSFRNPAQGDFIDETILSTPLPEATSTVNVNRSLSATGSVKPISTSNLASRLTGTIEELKSLHDGLNSAEKLSVGQNNSILSVTDLAFDQKLGSKGSLGILDIDALLANESINETQEIMDNLHKVQKRAMPAITNRIDNDPICSNGGSSNKSHSNVSGLMSRVSLDGSAVGVPSFFLAADNSVSEDGSFSEMPLGTNTMSETSAEVAEIMAKDSSFDSGRISFDQGEMSGRSTSLGDSGSCSKRSLKSLKNMTDASIEGEEFIADEELLKKLNMDELSFAEKQLPPIINPDQIPDPNSSSISVFSGVHEGEQIMVRPSWIGLAAENDDPVNISIGQYFRLKSDAIPQDKRPSFGMKIESPERQGGRGLIPQCPDRSSLESTDSTSRRNLNLTRVITPQRHVQSCASEDMMNISLISTPSVSCINNILREIDMSDSPGTMADKLLRYSSSPTGSKRKNQDPLLNMYSARNNMNAFAYNNAESKALIGRQKVNVWTPKVPPRRIGTMETSRELDQCDDGEGVKYEVQDVVKKLNSMERKGHSDKSALRMLSSFVNKLESEVAGPLDCSALYESLSHDNLVSSGPLGGRESEDEATSFASGRQNGDRCWVEVPEELLLVPDGDAVQQRHCVGIGFTAHVPIRNRTNDWLMYQVSPANGDGQLAFVQLPIQTLLAPKSMAEFEVIVVPMSVGEHFADIEVKVTNFTVQSKDSKCYSTKLLLRSSTPKVKVMTEELTELGEEGVLDFGVLPEECSKTLTVHILNIGLSNIPVRVVIDEVPQALKAFCISGASRSPLSNSSRSQVRVSSCSGIHLEENDVLSCDLSGSGPHAMVAIAITCQSPQCDWVTRRKRLSELVARLRIELDVPRSNLLPETTVLKEVILNGHVALTKLKVGVLKEPLTLFSEEVVSQSQQNNGRGAVPKKTSVFQKKFKMVSDLIPVFNMGAVQLDLTFSIQMIDGKEVEGDEFSVIPDSLSLLPGHRSSVRVIYQPKQNEPHECERVLSISMDRRNAVVQTVALKGVPVWEEDNAAWTEACPTDSSHPVIQTTHPRLVWGSVPTNSDYAESVFTLKNTSQAPERIVLSVKGSNDYKLLNHELDIVGNTSFEMLPKQSEKIKIFFRPKKLGPSFGKLIISVFDGDHTERKITDKMMKLSGYGGSSVVEVISLPRDLSGRLWLNLGLVSSNCKAALENPSPQNERSSRTPSPSSVVTVKNRLQIHNSGSLPAFVKIVPLAIGADPKTLSHLEEAREHTVTVRPDCCELEPSTSVTIWVSYVHRLLGNENNEEQFSKRGRSHERAYEEVANLLMVSGDIATRSRLQRIYKTAEFSQSNKDVAQFLGLDGTLLSFIGVTSCLGIKPELEEESNDSVNDAVNSLCDPACKETVGSLIQSLKTTEVLLVVEKDGQAKNAVNDTDPTLDVSSGDQVFHSLLEITNEQPSFLPTAPKISRSSGKIWSIEPEGTLHLGSVRGMSATVVLISHSSKDIFFEARVGFLQTDGRLKLIPPPHRQTVPVVVEPWQGQLLPHSCIKMKVILREMSEYPSKSGVLQVYSENDCLKVDIKVEGWATQYVPKGRTWKNTKGSEVLSKNERENRIPSCIPDDEVGRFGNAMSSQRAFVRIGAIFADTDSLVFPTTRVGSAVVLKLTLRNASSEDHEVIMCPVSRPYVVPRGSRELKALYYLSIRVAFHPQSAGNFEETLAVVIVARQSSEKNVLKVRLRGTATL